MLMDFEGKLIEGSLDNRGVLKRIWRIGADAIPVTPEKNTHRQDIGECAGYPCLRKADAIAEGLSEAISFEQGLARFVDCSNDKYEDINIISWCIGSSST